MPKETKIDGIGKAPTKIDANLPAIPQAQSFDLTAQVEVPLNNELQNLFTPEDFDGVTSAGLSLPRVRIRQKDEKGPDGRTTIAYAGDFLIYDKALDGMEISVGDVKGDTGLVITHLIDHESRVLFAKPFVNGAKPLCRSTNGRSGEGTPGGLCHLCPKSKFTDEGAPECALQREVLVYDHNLRSCYVLVLKRKGVKEYGDFLGFLINNIGKGVNPASSFVFRVTTKFFEYEKGNYYLPKFHVDGLTQVSRELWIELKKVRSTMQEQFESMATMIDVETEEVPSTPAAPAGIDRGGELPPGVTPVAQLTDDHLPF